MKFAEYDQQFQDILDNKQQEYPYDSEDYLNYVKLNQARIKRWRKTAKLNVALKELIESRKESLHWVLISEPWCGDAAHSHAFIEKLSELNPKISVSIQNRDAAGSEIDQYLTNGSKSIPILVIRDAQGKDLFRWGPRPKEAQDIVMAQKKDTTLSVEDKKKELQFWYNKDKGKSMQQELLDLFKANL